MEPDETEVLNGTGSTNDTENFAKHTCLYFQDVYPQKMETATSEACYSST